jgi:hypothetical protein
MQQHETAVHEDFTRTEEVQRSSDRSFGLVIAAAFTIIAFFPLLRSPPGAVRWWALAVAVVFAGCALFWTAPLAPLGRLWFLLGLLFGRIVNPIVLALMFYGAVLPIGLVMRMFGKSPFAAARKVGAGTYWVKREIPGPPPEAMKHQF